MGKGVKYQESSQNCEERMDYERIEDKNMSEMEREAAAKQTAGFQSEKQKKEREYFETSEEKHLDSSAQEKVKHWVVFH